MCGSMYSFPQNFFDGIFSVTFGNIADGRIGITVKIAVQFIIVQITGRRTLSI